MAASFTLIYPGKVHDNFSQQIDQPRLKIGHQHCWQQNPLPSWFELSDLLMAICCCNIIAPVEYETQKTYQH